MTSRSFAYVLLLGSVCLVACKSGGGGSQTFLEIVSFSPDDGRDDVQVEIVIGVRVSEPIDDSTLTTDTFFLADPDGNVVPSMVRVLDEPNANPSQMGTAAVLTPNQPLTILTDYTVTVTTGLRSTSGKQLEEDFDWSFKTLDSEWGEAEWIEPLDVGTSSGPQIGVDEELNAVAAWQFDDGTTPRIYANRYTRRDLWGEPEAIDDPAGGNNVRLAVAGDGNAFAVWERAEGPDQRIWSNRYDAAEQSWGEPALLQAVDAERGRLPAVAADPSGAAVAIWVEVDPETGMEIVVASRYDPDGGWGAAETIAAPNVFVAAVVTDVGMDDQGNAIAIWNPPAGPNGVHQIWTNRYSGSSWGEAEVVKPDLNNAAEEVSLDVGANGDAFVIWRQDNRTEMEPDPQPRREDTWVVRFSGGTWGAPARLDDQDADDKSSPDIAVDATGVAYAVWSQIDPDDFESIDDFANIWAAQYTPDSGWGSPVLIEPPNQDPSEDGDATTPRVDVNRAGNVFVVWHQNWEGWPSVWSNRRDPGGDWVGAELIEDFAGTTTRPTIVVDEARHAHGLWAHESEGGRKMRTNRFE